MKISKIIDLVFTLTTAILCIGSYVLIPALAINSGDYLLGGIAFVMNFIFWIYFYTFIDRLIKRGFVVFVSKPTEVVTNTIKNNPIYKVVDKAMIKKAKFAIGIQLVIITFIAFYLIEIGFDLDKNINYILLSVFGIITIVLIVNIVRLSKMTKLKNNTEEVVNHKKKKACGLFVFEIALEIIGAIFTGV